MGSLAGGDHSDGHCFCAFAFENVPAYTACRHHKNLGHSAPVTAPVAVLSRNL